MAAGGGPAERDALEAGVKGTFRRDASEGGAVAGKYATGRAPSEEGKYPPPPSRPM